MYEDPYYLQHFGVKGMSAVRKGREFAEEMGLDTTTIIDETGRIIKNASPNFGYE